MPEEFFAKLKKNIPTQWKFSFFTAIIVGLAVHLYKLANWLPNWDSLVFRYDPQNMVAMGRWFLPVACAPSSFYDLPWLNGLLAILLHALGAVCICKMFRVRKNTTAALIGAVVISFPTVASVLMYNYVADGYALAFLLSCMAAMLLVSEKPKYILSVICIALSAGIYQAYITVTVMLLLCYLILEALREDSKVGALIGRSLRILLAGAVGMALYYALMTIIIKITGSALIEYQGLDEAMSLSGIDLHGALYTIKNTFMDYFFDFSVGVSVFSILNCVILGLTAVLYITDIIRKKTPVGKILLVVFYAAFLPIASSLLALINSGVDYHNLMKMGFFVFYLFFILQYEKLDFKRERLNTVKAWTILTLVLVLVFNHSVIANVSYHKLKMAYEKSYGVLVRIADRIEQTEGAEDCDSILVLGALEDSEAYSANLPPDMTGTTDGYILRADDEVVSQSVLCSALNDYCGKDYRFLAGEEKSALLEKIDIDSMGIWPQNDSIFVIDNVIVIRLGDEVK